MDTREDSTEAQAAQAAETAILPRGETLDLDAIDAAMYQNGHASWLLILESSPKLTCAVRTLRQEVERLALESEIMRDAIGAWSKWLAARAVGRAEVELIAAVVAQKKAAALAHPVSATQEAPNAE